MLTALQERDGWYTSSALDVVKAVLRRKFFGMLEGHSVPDEACADLLDPEQGPTAVTREFERRRPGKHNMAKGALRPEDAAVR